jgi:hypothetical protein
LKYFCCGKETTNPLRIAAKDVEEFIVDRIETHMKDDDGNIFCLVHWQGYSREPIEEKGK